MVLPMESIKPLLTWRSSKDRTHTHICRGKDITKTPITIFLFRNTENTGILSFKF